MTEQEQDKLTKKLDKIAESHLGLSGGPESESYLHDAKTDKEEGVVWLTTDNSLAAKIVKRCRESIVDVEIQKYGMVAFKIERKAFRGIEYAFKTSTNSNRKPPTWLWDKKKKKDS